MDSTFYLDFISPYAYLAWKKLKQDNLLNALSLKPIVLGKIFTSIGQTPVTEVTSKRDYLYKVATECAKDIKEKITIPFQHPFNSLYLLRMSQFLISSNHRNALTIIDKLWDYTWRDKLDVANPEVLKEALLKDRINDAEEIIEHSFDKNIRLKIKENIKEALDQNVFGVPSFIVNSKLYWGFDTIEKFKGQLTC